MVFRNLEDYKFVSQKEKKFLEFFIWLFVKESVAYRRFVFSQIVESILPSCFLSLGILVVHVWTEHLTLSVMCMYRLNIQDIWNLSTW